MSCPPVEQRDRSLDALRALCMLYIVGYFHVPTFWIATMPKSLANMLARLVLALFCLMSGYLLAARYRLDDSGAVKAFYVRRILRIYPLYFLALSAFFALKLIPLSAYLPGVFLLHVYLQKPLLTLWFVSLIFFLYLLTPLYLRRPAPGKTLLLTAALYVPALLVRPYASGYLAAFAVGIFLAQQPQAKNFFLRPKTTTVAVSAALMGAMGSFVVLRQVSDRTTGEQLFGVACLIAALPFSLFLGGVTVRIVPWKIVALVSNASFALYLIHRIFYHLALSVYCPPLQTLASQFYLVCFLLPLAVLAAHAVQVLYDRALEKIFPSVRC